MKNTKHGVSPHFSIEALKQRYLACECPRERMRWHAIWHADTENSTTDCVGNFAGAMNGEEALQDKRNQWRAPLP